MNLPACPRCGDLCEPDDKRCACGTLLYYAPPQPRRIAWKPTYVSCACGCGASFTSTDQHKRPRRYKQGHNNKRGVQNGAKPKVSKPAKWWAENFTTDQIRQLAGGINP